MNRDVKQEIQRGLKTRLGIAATLTLLLGSTSSTWADSVQIGGGVSLAGTEAATANNDNVAVGSSSQATGNRSAAIGSFSQASADQTTAIGTGATASASHATALGDLAEATAVQSTAVGTGAMSSGTNSTALGVAAESAGTNSIAIGNNADAQQPETLAIGSNSTADANNGVAIGNNSDVTGNNAVALGNNSSATEANTVSVGNSATNLTRRVTNVSAGISGTDAVNVNQLNTAISGLEKEAFSGIAAAAALTSVTPSAPGKTAYNLSTASYKGQQAAAFSFNHRFANASNHLSLNGGISYTSSNDTLAKVGISWEY